MTEPSLSRKIIPLESRSSVELEISEIFVDGTFILYPHVEEKGLVFLSFRRGRVIISAGPYVGLIPLNPNLAVEILPRLPIGNLSQVLEIARASLGRLRRTIRTYLIAERPDTSVLAFIAANFVDAVRAIEVAGFIKQYSRHKQITSQPRGRILIGETRSRCSVRGRYSSVVTEQFKQTADVEYNQILKAALFNILKTFSSNLDFDTEIVMNVAQCYRDFPVEIRMLSYSERRAITTKYASTNLGNLRPEYQRALDIALMVLRSEGIALDRRGVDHTLNSFILNLEEIVESYFRNALRRFAAPDISVEDGNKEGKRLLFKNQPNGPFAQPDIILRQWGNSSPLISEVKYKTKIDRADINQAVTYAVTFATNDVVLIHIASHKDKRGSYLIGETGSVRVRGYAFDLSSENLEAEELSMYNFLVSLL